MIFDQKFLFSDHQNLAVAAGNHLSTNVYANGQSDDHPRGGVPVRDMGRGGGMPIAAVVTEDFAEGTSVQAQIVMADNATMTTGLVVVAQTAAIPVASLKAGYRFPLSQFPEGLTKPFVALRYVTVGAFTAGRIMAGGVLDVQAAPPW